jgi:hypothetical protein
MQELHNKLAGDKSELPETTIMKSFLRFEIAKTKREITDASCQQNHT